MNERLEDISAIGYLVPDAPEGDRWKRIGYLYATPSGARARVFLLAWRQGQCFSKPRNERTREPWPYINAPFKSVVTLKDDKPISVEYGYISTNTPDNGAVSYNIRLDSLPLTRWVWSGAEKRYVKSATSGWIVLDARSE